MRLRTSPSHLLLQLTRTSNCSEQETYFRQALTAIAQSAGAMGPAPLDGFTPQTLEGVAHLALERGLVDRLDWLAPGSAAVALYEIASLLPSGPVKRELRRRVFSFLYEGAAGTFIAVATRMALGSAGPLTSPPLRARIALSVDLPLGTSVNVAPLAFTLVTRSLTHEYWVQQASTGALFSRRLAAQLLEQAAREAVLRFQQGDPHPRNLLMEPRLRVSLTRLLRDREPLVWRHAAVARGLLAAIHPEMREEVEQDLDPVLGVTEWRRAGVSLVASTILGDEEAYRSVHSVIRGPLAERDPGILATLLFGLPRVIEFEPDRAEELMDRLALSRRLDVAVAFAELTRQMRDVSFAPAARAILRDCLAEETRAQSRAERSLSSSALRVLNQHQLTEEDLFSHVQSGLFAFEEQGARAAYEIAQQAIVEAHEMAAFVDESDPVDEVSLGTAMGALMELDASVFETPHLGHLLLLARRPGDTESVVEPLERLQNRTAHWILNGVESSLQGSWSRDRALIDQRRLRVLLHLVDAESAGENAPSRSLAHRLRRAILVQLAALREGPDAMIHRVLCAALARSLDAAAREGVVQASDLILVVAASLTDADSVSTLADASTTSDIAGPLSAWATFMQTESAESPISAAEAGMLHAPENAATEQVERALRDVQRVLVVSQGLVGGGGYQSEALRRTFFRLGRALESIAIARGQSELVETRDARHSILDELCGAVDDLSKMILAAERRVVGKELREQRQEEESVHLSDVVARAVSLGAPASADAIAQALQHLVERLPVHLAQIVEQVVFPIHQLPLESASPTSSAPLSQRRAVLPDWLLPRRMIGSFFVLRPLGSGGVSSVFVARRMEERNHAQAESFALKVPEYDPSTARSMSEQEFFEMFRDEAGALLSLPAHENLARFVTFDLAARPKPILVMELIRGTPLDRLIRSQSLTMPRVISYLDGVLSGLEAMHQAGLGHLDLKPSNVILRGGRTPVLVDFGLSGRKLRPGCGTVEYTAPEVLGVTIPDVEPSPAAADIYAFGCLMYEMLTGQLLFDAPDELSLISQHVSHDGWVDKLEALSQVPGFFEAARLMGNCLRRDPRLRPSASTLRNEVTRVLFRVAEYSWPIQTLRRVVGE